MTKLDKLSRSPRTFQQLTGLTPTQFNRLVLEVEPLFWAADARRRAKLANRQRKTGAGKQLKLSVAEQLFMLLLYYRTYITHVFLGFLMDVDDGGICRYFARLEPVVSAVFKVPERKVNLSEDEVWELIVDATEQRSNRSKGSGYSGKKKAHTLKTQAIVGRDRRIKSISKTVAGQLPDKRLYDQTKAYTTIASFKARAANKPPPRLSDLGYEGTETVRPVKKKRRKRSEPRDVLSDEQKAWNRLLGSSRAVVEHVFSFSGVKKYQILRDRYRNPVKRYNLTFKNIAGLHNFCLDYPDK